MSDLIVEVCRVDEIEKHPNADRLSIVKVKGWSCIVGLDNYEVGDLVVFIPPNCIVPDDIIEENGLEYLKKNGRTSTVKLRGYISEGLILDVPKERCKEGDDIADVLGIKKYEPPAPKYSVGGAMSASKKRINPNFHKYTSIENIKNYDNVFQVGDQIVVTEKIHGTNARFGNLEIDIRKEAPLFDKISMWFRKNILRKTHEFVYGSHNVQITNHSNRRNFYNDDVWGRIAKANGMQIIIGPDTIVYGEIYGSGVQELTYGIDEKNLVIFDIKFEGEYQDWVWVKAFCLAFDLNHVPELYIGEYYNGILEDFTSGQSVLCPEQIREGCVVKSAIEEKHPRIGRKILKSINPEYLIRKNRTEYK